MDEILSRLIDVVEETAPKLWAIALREVYGMVIGNVLWTVFALACAILCLIVGFRCARDLVRYADDSRWMLNHEVSYMLIACFGLFLGLVASIIAIDMIGETARWLYNPQFQAIKILLEMVK